MVNSKFSPFSPRPTGRNEAAETRQSPDDLEALYARLEASEALRTKEKTAADSAVRELKRAYFQSSERETRRIGQQLHDHLCQVLLGAAFSAKALADCLSSNPMLAGEAADLARLINSAVIETRNIARDLNPVALEPADLQAALRELTQHPGEKPICRLDDEPPVDVADSETALHVYRIAQEAIANAIRHASASEIVVRFWESAGLVHLQVSDNGHGLRHVQSVVKGLGLKSMRWRSEALGGGLEIENRPSGGTTVNCSFPQQR